MTNAHRLLLAALLFVALAPLARAVEVETKEMDYTTPDGMHFKGYLAAPADVSADAKHPGIVVFPEWWGMTDYPKMRARQLAELGYVALAADMYGDGQQTDDPKQAGTLMNGVVGDLAKLRARINAAFDTLRKEPNVDTSRMAATGYCFGGKCALELARTGTPLAGVVSFHGLLAASDPASDKNIKCPLLICTGDADPMVKVDQVDAFKKAMDDAGVKYQVDIYPGAQHAFTNPHADDHHIAGIKYDKDADEKSWAAMKAFLADVLK